MDNSKQLCATSSAKWIVMVVVVLFLAVYYIYEGDSVSSISWVSITVLLVILLPITVYYLVNSIYLTSEGVEKRRYGRIVGKLTWSDISQICILHDFPLSSKTSATTHIVITPKGCKKIGDTEYFGLQYMFIFRKAVIRIDNTKENRMFIEAHYGEMEDLRKHPRL